MFTGLVTVATLYFTVGISLNMVKDKSGEVTKTVVKLVKESSTWPKEVYDKMKKGDK